jgi:NAD(P)-dependent dehydrogenase (short-subunit alcohol dehydrogenase family)
MLMLELARRCAAAGINLLSNAAHPGYARTNLQTSGPGKPQNGLQKMFERFTSQDAAAGAMPTLRAATANDTASECYYGPERLFQLKGDPVEIPLPKPAVDQAAAKRLWSLSEELTRVSFAGL